MSPIGKPGVAVEQTTTSVVVAILAHATVISECDLTGAQERPERAAESRLLPPVAIKV